MTTDFDPTRGDGLARREQARRDGVRTQRWYVPYHYSDDALMAVRAALATGRPLLLRGEAGTGKSSMAFDAAMALGWAYYEKVFTSRTTADETMWTTDAVRRLADAQVSPAAASDLRNYVTAGPMWWAFEPSSAGKLGFAPPNTMDHGPAPGAVLLLDEIDKAEPDVPNDLLQPLGDGKFHVPELAQVVTRTRPLLIVVTSNQERALTRAFLRRCVCLTFPAPSPSWLAEISLRHFPDVSLALVEALTEALLKYRAASPDSGHRPGVSELLDAIRACHEFQIDPHHRDWDRLLTVLMKKSESGT